MALETRALVYAVTLAQFGSFARAAKALGMTQPALSRAIAALEENLRVILFDRNPRGVAPTPQGERFLARAAEILSGLDELAEDVAAETPRQSWIRIGLGPMIGALLTSGALAGFAERHPGIDLRIFLDFGDRLAQMLRSREVELVIASGVTFADDPDLHVVRLPDLPVKPYVRPTHPLAGRGPATIEAIRTHRIALVSASSDRNWVSASIRNAFGFTPRLVLANSVHAIRDIVAGTDAVGVEIEPLIAPEVAAGRFAWLSAEFSLPPTRSVIAWHTDHSRSAPIQELARAAALQLGVAAPTF